ncbi:MAG: AsmA family protein [Bacteroidaceae bacterium]|nr:AsmA family protein [Bacteroidaceae bacterium]
MKNSLFHLSEKGKKRLVKFGKIIAILVGVIILLGVVAFFTLNSSSFQAKMLGKATDMLQEKLETKVQIDRIYFDLLEFDVELYGVDIEDREQRKMFQMDELEVALSLRRLLMNEISLKKASINGLRARLYKEDDQPANYQFVIDAFKKDTTETQGEEEAKKKKKMAFNISKANIKNIDVSYNENQVKIGDISYHQGWIGGKTGTVKDVYLQWTSETKKGPNDNLASIDKMKFKEEGEGSVVELEGLHFRKDNRLPRKNTGKPKRGYFDAGHLDITANMTVALHHIDKDSICASLYQCTAKDTVTGFDIRDLRCDVTVIQGVAHIKNLQLQQVDTKLKIEKAEMVLPNKKDSIPLSFSTGTITGTAYLRDIARPFAPALENFKLPVTLSLNMNGTDEALHFRDVKVKTPDNKLSIDATGDITNLKGKEDLSIVFNVSNLTTTSPKVMDIINQFTVKKLMMDQLKMLGTIGYKGTFGVYWKREAFNGVLSTKAGDLNFDLELDEKNKYLNGSLSSKSLDIGRTFEVDGVGNLACRAKFNIDISKERTAQIRTNKNGNLPIGKVHVDIDEANYKKIRTTNISADIESDGCNATGNVQKPGKLMDFSLSFVYTSTTEGHSVKIKPSLGPLKKKTEEEKAARREAKEQKKQEKALKKEQKKQEKAEKKKNKSQE